jgi:hypothetical protein
MSTTTRAILDQDKGPALIELLLGMLFAASTVSLFAIGNISMYGYGLQTALWSASGVSVTAAFVVTMLAGVGAYATNQIDFDGLDELEVGALAVVIVLTVATPFVPPVNDLLTTDYIWGSAAAALNILAFGYLAWE